MKPYGCHSKPRAEGYWALSTYYPKSIAFEPERGWVWVDDVMTKECHYRTTTPDPRCEGCTCP